MPHITAPLNAQTLEDGSALERFNDAILRICADVQERARVTGKRSATLKVTVEPDLQGELGDEMNFPSIAWSVETSVPGHAGRRHSGFIEDGKIMINLITPGEPNQTSIPGVESNITPFDTQQNGG